MLGSKATLAVLLLALALLSAGCRSAVSRDVPQEDIDFAQRYLALFATRSLPAIEMGMDPSIKDPQIRLKLIQMATVFPREPPVAIRTVLAQRTRSGEVSSSNLSFQYEYPDRWLRADVVVERTGPAPVIKGVHVQALKEPLERTHRVTLAGKGAAHYLAVAAPIAVVLFVIYTLLLAIRSPIGSIKWAWAAFILVGVSQAVFNWSTGQFTFVPMSMQLLAAGFTRSSPYAPLLISTSIPVGAIVFLIQRRDLLRRSPDDQYDDDDLMRPAPDPDRPRSDRASPVRVRPGSEAEPRRVEASEVDAVSSPRDRSEDR